MKRDCNLNDIRFYMTFLANVAQKIEPQRWDLPNAYDLISFIIYKFTNSTIILFKN